MARITLRNLADDVKAQLRVRAAKNQRSMEAEVRAVLTESVRGAADGASFVARFRKALEGLEVELQLPARTSGRLTSLANRGATLYPSRRDGRPR